MKKFGLIFLLCTLFSININAEELKPPNVEAAGAVIMDLDTGRVLWGRNEHKPLAMASTTKIMTALLTLERANLKDTVTVSRRAASAPEVNMDLRSGEKIGLDTLMYALMLQSSNDAAVAIAEHVSGSVENFCKDMTMRAKELGAYDTVFETPNGLDLGEHHSTAYDMALITREALKNPDFIRITNTQSIQAKSDKNSYHISNKNRLLNEFDGANGVKTGFTGKAGHCFVGAAKRGDMQLISVVLASGWGNAGKEQKWIDTKRLLNFGFANFKYKDIIGANTEVKEVAVKRSKTDSVTLYYKDGLRMPLTDAEASSLKIEVIAPDEIMPPIMKGDKLGVAKVYIDNELVKEIELLANASAERHDLKTSLEKIISEWLSFSSLKETKIVLPEF